jgi:hypothetical protein
MERWRKEKLCVFLYRESVERESVPELEVLFVGIES